ncbi:MAG: hypothetical protein ACXWT1_05810 [Methylobacter sp.]
MSAVRLNRGDTWQRTWLIKVKATQQPIDLTGATVRSHVRDNAKALVYAASTANGDIVVDGVAGKLSLTVAASVTATWTPGTYKFDIEVTYPDTTVKTYESSVLAILEDQSHD